MENEGHLSFEEYSKLYIERNGETTPFALRSTYNLYLQTKNPTETKHNVEDDNIEPIDTKRTENLNNKTAFEYCTKEPTKKELLTIFGFILGKADKSKVKYLINEDGTISFGFSTFPLLAGDSDEIPIGYRLIRQTNGSVYSDVEFRLEEERTLITITRKDVPIFTPKSLLSRINEETEPIVLPIPFLILLLQTRKECVKESPKYPLEFTFLTIADDIKVITLNSEITLDGILGNEGGERPYILSRKDILTLEKFLKDTSNVADKEFPDVLEAVPYATVETLIDYFNILLRLIYYYYCTWILDATVEVEIPYRLEYGFSRRLNIIKTLEQINDMNTIVYNAFRKAIKLGIFEKNITGIVYRGVNRNALLREYSDEPQSDISDLESKIEKGVSNLTL